MSAAAVLLLIVTAFPSVDALPAFYNGPDGWAYRVPVTVEMDVDTTIYGAYTQVPVPFDGAGLIAAGKMAGGCVDLRMADDQGNILDHWVEGTCNSPSAVAWVRIPGLVPGVTKLIYLYYGNPGVATTSSVSATFPDQGIRYGVAECYAYETCAMTNHATVDAFRAREPYACAGYTTKIDWGNVCTSQPPATNSSDKRISQYKFLFTPDVTGTWNVGIRGDNYSEASTYPYDKLLTHNHNTIAVNNGDCGSPCAERTGPRTWTINTPIWMNFIVSDTTGPEQQTLRFQRPGGGYQVLSTTNFPGMVRHRQYADIEPYVAIGAEEKLALAPQSVQAIEGPNNGMISVSWTAPANNGVATTGYTVHSRASPGDAWSIVANTTAKNFNHTGLPHRAYREYVISASSALGRGPFTPVAGATTYGPPYAPPSVSVTPGNHSATLTWTTPNDGGRMLTGYRIYSGSSPSPLQLLATTANPYNTSFIVNGLTNGVPQYFAIAAVNSIGVGDQTGSQAATPKDTPYPPASLIGARGDELVSLSWTPGYDNGAALTGYRIYAAAGDGDSMLVATTSNGANMSFLANGLTNGQTYTFHVIAVNALGASPSSNAVIAKPARTPEEPDLASATPLNQSVALSWSPGSDGGEPITSYRVYRGASVNDLGTLVATVPAGSTSASIAGTNGVPYWFEVTAVNVVGEGGRSARLVATPGGVPYPPGDVAIAAGNRTGFVTWSAPYDNGRPILDYVVLACAGEPACHYPNYPTIFTYAESGQTIGSLQNGTTYYVEVSARNAFGDGGSTGWFPFTPLSIPDPPILVDTSFGDGSIALGWNESIFDGGSPITHYRVWRAVGDGNLTPVATTSDNAYLLTGLTNGETYRVMVTAVTDVGESAGSRIDILSPGTTPGAPQTFSVVPSDGAAILGWDDIDAGGRALTDHRIYMGTDGGPLSLIASTGSGASTGHTVSGLTNGVSYAFQVAAVNSLGEGARSDILGTVPRGVPSAPGGLTAFAGNRTVALAWQAAFENGAPIQEYLVYRAPDGGPYSLIGVVGGQTTSYTDATAQNGVSYRYAVTALNAAGEGPQGVSLLVTPSARPWPPQLLAAMRGDMRVDLSWVAGYDEGSAISQFTIWRAPAGGEVSFIKNVAGGVTTFRDANVTNGAVYEYHLTAMNARGMSDPSNMLSARPARAPDAPRSLVGSFGDASASISWLTPVADGGEPVTHYRAWVGPSPEALAPHGPSILGTNTIVEGLTNGVTYHIAVAATNAAGESVLSNVITIKPIRPPDPPAVVGTAGSRHASLSWTPGWDGGSALNAYRIYRATGGGSLVLIDTIGTNTTYVANGLVDGTTYRFAVAGRNIAGTGLTSDAVFVTPTGPPGAPTITSVSQGASTESIRITWTPPTTNGGSAILHQRLYAADTPNSPRWLVQTLDAGITQYVDPLEAGGSRTYTISAVNAVGEGALSNAATGSRLVNPLDPALPDTYRTCTRDVNTGVPACSRGSVVAVVGVSAGARHSCALLDDARVDCYGDAGQGQAADHLAGRPVVQVSAGGVHTCALLDNGNVDCWGTNSNGKATSYLGNNAIAVASGGAHTCIQRADGTVFCQGANSYGQAAGANAAVRAVAAGAYNTCYLRLDGTVFCHGLDDRGQNAGLGTNDGTQVSVGGFHGCAARVGGLVSCWGEIAAPPSSIQGRVSSVASGRLHACALLDTGSVSCWGSNRDGQSVGYAGADAVALALGDAYSCVLRASGTIACWGGSAGSDHGQAQAYPLVGGEPSSEGASAASASSLTRATVTPASDVVDPMLPRSSARKEEA